VVHRERMKDYRRTRKNRIGKTEEQGKEEQQ
jgi:hypothetical protein